METIGHRTLLASSQLMTIGSNGHWVSLCMIVALHTCCAGVSFRGSARAGLVIMTNTEAFMWEPEIHADSAQETARGTANSYAPSSEQEGGRQTHERSVDRTPPEKSAKRRREEWSRLMRLSRRGKRAVHATTSPLSLENLGQIPCSMPEQTLSKMKEGQATSECHCRQGHDSKMVIDNLGELR